MSREANGRGRSRRGLRVCVVGAGMSGLAVIKELKDEGHHAVCFEREHKEGGTFNLVPGAARRPMRLTVSQYFMAFSSLPPDLDEEPRYWTGKEYLRYLRRYAERFDLLRHVRFDCEVTGIRRTEDGSFVVEYRRRGETRSEQFDAVAICRGAFRRSHPRMPRLAGAETFKGPILHSADYPGPEPFRGKRVLCIGMGETSADVTDEISEVARSCWLSMRRYPALMARYPFGGAYTHDTYTTRLTQWRHHEEANRFLLGMCRVALARESDTRKRLPMEWMLKSRTPSNMSLSKNDDFAAGVAEGRIRAVVSAVSHLDGSRVSFADGNGIEVDAIVCCTGYEESSIPRGWIEGVELSDVRNLYLHAFQPELGERAAFIGWARPAQGGVPACSEMLARYFALLCSAKRRLPPRARLERIIDKDREDEEREFSAAPGVRTLVNYTPYMDRLAGLIGCEPRLLDYVEDPGLLCRLLAASNIAASYRLRGPHADPDGAREVLMRLPIGFASSVMLRRGYRVLKARFDPPVAERILASLKMYLEKSGNGAFVSSG